jgi:tetratricopeptide (TPR) repeat protein
LTAALRPTLDRDRGQVELALADGEPLALGPLVIERLALAAGPEATDQDVARWQRRRTRLAGLTLRIDEPALAAAVANRSRALAAAGVTDLALRVAEEGLALTAKVTDGLAAAELSAQLAVVARGRTVRVLLGSLRVHGHLPTPAPLVVQRALEVLVPGEGPLRVVGLLEVEVDLAELVAWQLLPPAGWRLPAIDELRVTRVTPTAGAMTVALADAGETPSPGPLGAAWSVAHAAMATADDLLRRGQLDEAMRGYRALLAAAGPDQPALLERILAITAARPSWFVDGRELARQALARWPEFTAAHAALASIALAEGDTREAASRLATVAQLAPRQGDRDGGVLAALAAARLYRVIDPPAATPMYQRAVALAPGLVEADLALAERWPTRAATASESPTSRPAAPGPTASPAPPPGPRRPRSRASPWAISTWPAAWPTARSPPRRSPRPSRRAARSPPPPATRPRPRS